MVQEDLGMTQLLQEEPEGVWMGLTRTMGLKLPRSGLVQFRLLNFVNFYQRYAHSYPQHYRCLICQLVFGFGGFLRFFHSLLGAVMGALSDLVTVLIDLDVGASNHNTLLIGQLNRPSMRLQQKYFEGSTNR